MLQSPMLVKAVCDGQLMPQCFTCDTTLTFEHWQLEELHGAWVGACSPHSLSLIHSTTTCTPQQLFPIWQQCTRDLTNGSLSGPCEPGHALARAGYGCHSGGKSSIQVLRTSADTAHRAFVASPFHAAYLPVPDEGGVDLCTHTIHILLPLQFTLTVEAAWILASNNAHNCHSQTDTLHDRSDIVIIITGLHSDILSLLLEFYVFDLRTPSHVGVRLLLPPDTLLQTLRTAAVTFLREDNAVHTLKLSLHHVLSAIGGLLTWPRQEQLNHEDNEKAGISCFCTEPAKIATTIVGNKTLSLLAFNAPLCTIPILIASLSRMLHLHPISEHPAVDTVATQSGFLYLEPETLHIPFLRAPSDLPLPLPSLEAAEGRAAFTFIKC
jgi:hypothetical protein